LDFSRPLDLKKHCDIYTPPLKHFFPFPDEIAGVQQATVQFIEDAAANNDENFHYVLVPFNDPGEPY
jgi:hypothetical protein